MNEKFLILVLLYSGHVDYYHVRRLWPYLNLYFRKQSSCSGLTCMSGPILLGCDKRLVEVSFSEFGGAVFIYLVSGAAQASMGS